MLTNQSSFIPICFFTAIKKRNQKTRSETIKTLEEKIKEIDKLIQSSEDEREFLKKVHHQKSENSKIIMLKLMSSKEKDNPKFLKEKDEIVTKLILQQQEKVAPSNKPEDLKKTLDSIREFIYRSPEYQEFMQKHESPLDKEYREVLSDIKNLEKAISTRGNEIQDLEKYRALIQNELNNQQSKYKEDESIIKATTNKLKEFAESSHNLSLQP